VRSGVVAVHFFVNIQFQWQAKMTYAFLQFSLLTIVSQFMLQQLTAKCENAVNELGLGGRLLIRNSEIREVQNGYF
jgi:hypothetical protein